MAEVPATDPVPSSSEEQLAQETKEEVEGPTPEKRRKLEESEPEKLEHRLGGILCCAVCLDLPPAAVYQCSNGHLMCAPCFTHLLADARLRDEASTCPNCRVEISKTSASRNLAVEKTVSELPSECKYCAGVFPRHSISHHEDNKCEEREFKFTQIVVDAKRKRSYQLDGLVRMMSGVYSALLEAVRRACLLSTPPQSSPPPPPLPTLRARRRRRVTVCQYACIGCPWRGPQHESASHAAACTHPGKSASDVVSCLLERERQAALQNKLYAQLLDLLSYEKITFNDLQLKPYRTEEFVHKLYYETSRFSAFGHQFVVKAFVNKNQRDPTQSYERELSYQVILKSKTPSPIPLQWLPLRGPFGEAAVTPRVSSHCFSEDAGDAPPAPLPLADPADTNRLLSNKAIHFRLIMFLATK